MIIGIGHDLTGISRVQKILAGVSGERFVRRIFSDQEYAAFIATIGEKRQAEFVAGRFAVKEAVSKAFGCGIGALLGFHDIKLMKNVHGKPICSIETSALNKLGYKENELTIHVTITHERELASAFVVIEKQ